MPRWWYGSLAVLLVCALDPALVLAAMPEMPITQNGTTARYHLMLQIGPTETMYTKAEAATKHATSGEIMVGGTMGMPRGSMAGGAMATDSRHLEVHVTSLATGKVVTDAKCQITVMNDVSKMSQTVPVAMMYGVREGPADWHYGNNVSMPPGTYTVRVVVNGERAVFHVTIPKV